MCAESAARFLLPPSVAPATSPAAQEWQSFRRSEITPQKTLTLAAVGEARARLLVRVLHLRRQHKPRHKRLRRGAERGAGAGSRARREVPPQLQLVEALERGDRGVVRLLALADLPAAGDDAEAAAGDARGKVGRGRRRAAVRVVDAAVGELAGRERLDLRLGGLDDVERREADRVEDVASGRRRGGARGDGGAAAAFNWTRAGRGSGGGGGGAVRGRLQNRGGGGRCLACVCVCSEEIPPWPRLLPLLTVPAAAARRDCCARTLPRHASARSDFDPPPYRILQNRHDPHPLLCQWPGMGTRR